jgi:hypothetical protein
MATQPPLTKPQALLDPKTAATLAEARPLSDYRLNFANGRYPVLSMIYAIYAGGENTFYCDYSGDFVQAYLIDSVVRLAEDKANAAFEAARAHGADLAAALAARDAAVDAARTRAQATAATIGAKFETLINYREKERQKPAAQQDIVQPDETDFNFILGLIKTELMQKDPSPTAANPNPRPDGAPPLPMW